MICLLLLYWRQHNEKYLWMKNCGLLSFPSLLVFSKWNIDLFKWSLNIVFPEYILFYYFFHVRLLLLILLHLPGFYCVLLSVCWCGRLIVSYFTEDMWPNNCSMDFFCSKVNSHPWVSDLWTTAMLDDCLLLQKAVKEETNISKLVQTNLKNHQQDILNFVYTDKDLAGNNKCVYDDNMNKCQYLIIQLH